MRNTLLKLLVVTTITLSGCNSDNSKQNLSSGYQALDAQQFDEAMAKADAQLSATPTGPGTAEALYLKGRALEQKAAGTPQEARQNMMQARDAYTGALQQNPAPPLAARIHAGIANASYWVDDYATAVSEWSAAYTGFDDPTVRSFMLYRIGLSQQRLGQFSEADQSFAAVQKDYPGTDAAGRARDHQGYKSFTVQLGTFASASGADAEISKLRTQGVNPMRGVNAKGNTVVSVGPALNYAQAVEMKNRFAATYPQAIILPQERAGAVELVPLRQIAPRSAVAYADRRRRNVRTCG